jgi:septal ring factor EnvC (AmiA/AmiB activator)
MNPYSMYRHKRKREVDPNAPPRPNLLSHEKTLKETGVTIAAQSQRLQDLELRIQQLEQRLRNQSGQLNDIISLLNHRLR